MTAHKDGLLLCISGPSGVGKGTVIQALLAGHPERWLSVSMTTRAPRPGEEEGVHYFFARQEDFETRLAAGEILEHDCFCGSYYGTPLAPIREHQQAGQDILLDITISGSLAIKSRIPEAILVYLLPPDFPTLARRLSKRATESEEQRICRLQEASSELARATTFDYLVVNDKLEETVADLEAILRAERSRRSRQAALLESICREAQAETEELPPHA